MNGGRGGGEDSGGLVAVRVQRTLLFTAPAVSSGLGLMFATAAVVFSALRHAVSDAGCLPEVCDAPACVATSPWLRTTQLPVAQRWDL